MGFKLGVRLAQVAVCCAAVVGLAEHEQSSAQDAIERVVPPPSECSIAPRSTDVLLALTGQQEAPSEASPSSPPSRLEIVGKAESNIVADIQATLRGLVACNNAGDLLRQYAHYSDAFLQRRVGIEPSDLELPPSPLAEEDRMAILGIPYVMQLSDGRVGAVVVLDDPRARSPVQPFFWVFARSGQKWLFDDWPDPYITTVESSVEPIDGQ